jgi:hypothetical protein
LSFALAPQSKTKGVQNNKTATPVKRSSHGRGANMLATGSHDSIIQLQETIGNQAVQRLIRSGISQKSLKVHHHSDPHQHKGGNVADEIMMVTEPESTTFHPTETHIGSDNICESTIDSMVHENEADRYSNQAVTRLKDPQPNTLHKIQSTASGIAGLGTGRRMSSGVRQSFEGAFGWDFSGVRLHTGPAAAKIASSLGARAFTHGRDIVFGNKVSDPEGSNYRRLMAHELTHVIQQDMGTGLSFQSSFASLSASPSTVQMAPLVTNVVTSAAEIGVGGNDITATATVGGAGTPLTWTINPGAVAPAGVSVIGTGRRVRIHAGQPGGGIAVGGTPIVIRAGLAASPGDFFDASAVMLVQVLSASYTATPPLVPVPSLVIGIPPPNSAEPNRDGISGNTAVVNTITAPAGRSTSITFRRPLGARLAGTTITPGSTTGDIGLRITDRATRARLDETQPATLGPAALMANLTVNAVPTRVRGLTTVGPLGPYGVMNTVNFLSSDSLHLPLTRIVGELITNGGDHFNLVPPNGAFNPTFNPNLAVPANQPWNDQLVTLSTLVNVTDGRIAIDVNRFVGPGVPQLPRRVIYRQRFQYSSWQGAATVISRTIADGQHRRSLIGSPGAFRFMTEHRFGGVAAPPRVEPYIGPPLIVLTGIVATPTAPGATGLAADGFATANLGVTSSVAGRIVGWSILEGGMAITAGNPATLPATATIRAGLRTGNFRVRAADSIYRNRRVDGRVRLVAVRLHNMHAALNSVPAGTLTTNVTINAEPGGRNLNWSIDPTAATAGVSVTPAVTGPGNAMSVVVTRPVGLTGRVTVTARDTVLPARRESVRIRFL